MSNSNLFTYKNNKIISAVPAADIEAYLTGLGATKETDQIYTYAGLEIEVVPYNDDSLPDIGVPRHLITVCGDKTETEDFLTAFRFKFMSAGG